MLTVRDIVAFEKSYITRNVVIMERSRIGLLMISIGAILFIISLFIILLQFDLYLISLFAMFISVVLIAVGFSYRMSDQTSMDNSDNV